MKKTTLFLTIISALSFVSCGGIQQKKNEKSVTVAEAKRNETIKFDVLYNYFIHNKINFENEVNLLSVKDEVAFHTQFGVAKTMNNKIVVPNFTTNAIVAVACKSSNIVTTIEVKQITADETGLTIHVGITKGETRNFYTLPVVLLSFAKQADGAIVKVMDGKTILATGVL